MFKGLIKRHRPLVLVSIILLALCLRAFRAGQPIFKEDENTTVNAASYLYFCHQDQTNCRHQSDTFNNRLIALLTSNETRPNLITQIYFWDWSKSQPTDTHYARAWPDLYLISFIYKYFNISHLSSRIVAIISSSLLIILGFFLARLLALPQSISLVYAFTLATSYHLISLSRLSRMYALFSLAFLSTIFFASKFIKSKKLINLSISLLFFSLAYFLQLLTLLLPLAILIFSLYQAIFKHQRFYMVIFCILVSLLLLLFYLKFKLNLDFFHSNFIAFQSKPHWEYLVSIFGSKSTAFIGWGLILVNLKKIFSKPFSTFLFTLLIVNLLFSIFFFNFSVGSAYVAHLIPISYLLVLMVIKNFLIIGIFTATILVHLLLNAGSLYIYPYSRPQIVNAYHSLSYLIKSGDQLIGSGLREYYLQDLPQPIVITQLPFDQIYTLKQFILDFHQTNNNVFVIYEQEKQRHFEPELIEYLQANAKKIAGQGIDNYEVEIYYLEK